MKTFFAPFRCLICATFGAAMLTARADVITTWNREMIEGNARQMDVAPHLELRTYAITHRAMLDAIAEVSRTKVNGNVEHAQLAAASSAAHQVLVELRPKARARFDATQTAQLGGLPASSAKTEGVRRGQEVAARVLRSRAVDGWLKIASDVQPAGRVSGGPLDPEKKPPSPWLKLQPFALKTVREIQAPELYTTFVDGALCVDERLRRASIFDRIEPTAGPAEIRQLWRTHPAGTWNRIACDLAARAEMGLPERARLFAALNAALADATVAAAHWQFVFGSWRASTNQSLYELLEAVAKQEVDAREISGENTPGNIEERIEGAPRTVLLPPVRNHPAADAAVAGAAVAVLVSCLRGDKVAFSIAESSPSGHRPTMRSFGSISAAAQECAFASSLDGQHTREACVAGYELGQAVGERAARRTSASR
jgi:hypothetical protein